MYIERKRERERRLSLEKNESERHEFEQRIRVGIEEYIEGVQYFNWFSKNGKKHHEKCALQNLNDLKLLVCLKQKNTHPNPTLQHSNPSPPQLLFQSPVSLKVPIPRPTAGLLVHQHGQWPKSQRRPPWKASSSAAKPPPWGRKRWWKYCWYPLMVHKSC